VQKNPGRFIDDQLFGLVIDSDPLFHIGFETGTIK